MTNREKRIETLNGRDIYSFGILECLDLLTEENTALDSTLEGLDVDATDDDLLSALREEVYYGIN